MKFIFRIIWAVAANLAGLWLAVKILSSFRFSGTFSDLLYMAIILTVLNWTVKPVIKLVLSPLILLTLGLGLIAVNMIILYILDIFSPSLTIETNAALTLFLASIIIGFINIIAHAIANSVKST